jgi:hypothetical protein
MTSLASAASDVLAATGNIKEPRLLDRLRMIALEREAAANVDKLVSWARAFTLFHHLRHPREMGLEEVTYFLQHVVKTAKDPLAGLAQARSVLTLLYDRVLGVLQGELPHPRPPRLGTQRWRS